MGTVRYVLLRGVSFANSTPASSPTAVCAARPIAPRTPKMPTVPNNILSAVNSTKIADPPATPKTIRRWPLSEHAHVF
jgi:hypothetical protein